MSLAVFITAANKNDGFPAVQPVINAQSKHAATHGFAIAKIPGANSGQSRVPRRLPSHIAKGIKPFIKWNESTLNLQLLYFPFSHLQCNL
jgi:hypothetical protein